MMSSKEAVKELIRIYSEPFGGKQKGRYKISRELLGIMLGTKNLGKYLPDIMDLAIEKGYIVDDIGDYISVLELSMALSYRPATKKVIFKNIANDDDSIESEDEIYTSKSKDKFFPKRNKTHDSGYNDLAKFIIDGAKNS